MGAVVKEIRVAGVRCSAVRVDLPGAPLLLIVAPKGYLMCGYLNVEVAERLGQAAATVTGVRSFEDMLGARVVRATARARELGVVEGMTGEEALRRMS